MTYNSLLLLLAQGFGLGRVPVAPGTFGALGGLAWFALLLWFSSGFLFVIGTIILAAVSVWAGTQAERALGEKDPSSVVLDEIAAMPVCFAALLVINWNQNGRIPGIDFFFGAQGWIWTIGVFLGFRFFDIVKPWPVRQTQDLPGGWGVTVDDLVAALYVNVCVALIVWLR